jgi:hypothetical protein
VLETLPRRDVGRWLALSALGAFGVLGGLEVFWRRRGFEPQWRDSPEIWFEARQSVLAAGRRGLAIVGSSRFQLGIDPRVLKQHLPQLEPVQLAINGSPALPVLLDLANDPEFKGTALCEVMPQNFFTASALRLAGVPWLGYGRTRTWVAGWESDLRKAVQEHVASVLPAADLQVVAKQLAHGKGLPKPSYIFMRPDRFMEADYRRVDTKVQLEHWVERARQRRAPSAAELERVLSTVGAACDLIARRGGRVIFVRMISSLELRDIEDAVFPRDRYWDLLLARSGAAGIYDTELPAAAGLVCPEGSHLDAAQARVFTADLGEELKRRGLAAAS